MDRDTDQGAFTAEAISQYADAELMKRLDERTRWFIVDREGCALASAVSLRVALGQVRMLLCGGRAPHLLVCSSGHPVVIQENQLARMYTQVMPMRSGVARKVLAKHGAPPLKTGPWL